MCPSSTSNSEHTGVAPDGLIEVFDLASLPRASVVGLGLATAVVAVLTLATLALDVLAPARAAKPIGQEAVAERKKREAAAGFRGFATGRMAALFESDFKARSRVRAEVVPMYSLGLFRIFGVTKGLAVIGSGDRTYLTARIQPDSKFDDATMRLAFNRIAAVERRFAGAGIAAVPVIIPRKAAVERDHLPATLDPRPDLERRFEQMLAAAHVRSPALMRTFTESREAAYWKLDSHWSDEGCRIGAEAATRAAGRFVEEGDRRTLVRKSKRRREPADLLTTLGIVDEKLLAMASPPALLGEIFHKDSARLARKTTEKTPTPLSVVGTSFTAHSNFVRYLEHYSDQPIYSGARPGAGPVDPVRDIVRLAQESGRWFETLIWEIPAHYLFCLPGPLDEIGTTVLGVKSDHLVPLVDAHPWLLENARVSKPTAMTLRKREGLTQHFGNGAVVASGDGIVSLRLRGRLTKGQAYARVAIGKTAERINLKTGPFDVVLPMIAADAFTDCVVSFRSDHGEAELVDFLGELTTDIESSTGLRGVPNDGPKGDPKRTAAFDAGDSTGRRAAIVAELAPGAGCKELSVTSRCDDGTLVSLIGRDLRGRVLLIQSVREFEGKHAVAFEATASPTPKSAKWVTWVRQSKSRIDPRL